MAEPEDEPSVPRLTLAQLDALRAVLSTRGVSDAARLLDVSQPAVSKLLRQVERSLGLPLVQRDGNRVIPTREAEMLQWEVEQLFGSYDSIQRLAAALRGETGVSIHVAAIPTQATRFAVPAIKLLRERQPDVLVKLEILANPLIIDAVVSGRAEFGLVHSMTVSPELKAEDIGEHHVVCIAPAGHRFGGLAAIGREDFRGETFVSYGPNTIFGRWLSAEFGRGGANIPVDVEITASPTLVEAVENGIGVALVEEAALSPMARSRLVVRPLTYPLTFRSRILRMPGRAMSRQAELLLEFYREVVERGHDRA
ncbi:LysR family transcriptional regulator [Phreatobacter stygius]|uniref:LysR family transcriptional regulator n=1 Tax=Phreatobacter stygius TaxID=1940610 RepID=A0A4D7BBB6_9HYPH|nr:LysR family transcriptional regulator [Phreatobacter stygius]QCI66736.1 LysR family transcriptional regulator [Phreatobacter stygius]